jgi:hypothetical protein
MGTAYQERLRVELWNRDWPVGSVVDVIRDDGSTLRTRTSSEAWQLGSGEAVVKVEEISGGYQLTRVHPVHCTGELPQEPGDLGDRAAWPM